MPDLEGKALAMAVLTLTAGLGSLAEITQGSPDEPHAPIEIIGDSELRSNACGCVRNPGASGTASDPFIIADWRIDTDDTAIRIKDISEEHFVIRDNSIEGDTGIQLINTGDRGRIVDNPLINFADLGVHLKDSSATVRDNKIQGALAHWPDGSRAVHINGGSPTIDGNVIANAAKGITAGSTTATIADNVLRNADDAIRVTDSSEVRIVRNTIKLTKHWGIYVEDSAKARVISNFVNEGQGGILSEQASLYLQNNTITNQKREAVRFHMSTVQMFRNTISNNWRGAFGSADSDVLIRNNTFRDNGDGEGPNENAGLRLDASEGRVVDNTLVGNDIGIKLHESIITLEDNVLRDNRWGLSIPYNSKGSIPLMSGNVVNGVNVDGTVRPAEQRIFYEETAIELSGKTVNSGATGSFGTLFKQGALVVYDSQNVTIENSSFKYNDVAIHIRDSSFVRVRDNEFMSNHKAVVSVDSRTFIKDNECDIEIDPPHTVCFEAKGGFVTVRSNLAAHVAVGVHFHAHAGASAKGIIANNDIRSTTEAGLKLEGDFDQTEHDVQVLDNEIEANVVGAVLLHFKGRLESNLIANSTGAAAHLDDRTNATFVDNQIIFNAKGLVDVDSCMDNYRTPCSTGVFVENKFKHNTGVAVHLENGGSFEGDLFVENKVGARIQGETRMVGVNVSENAKLGLRVREELTLRDANVSANGKVGVMVVGELEADNVTASANIEDGIRVTGRAELRGVVAQNNSDDGAELTGSAEIREGNFSGNAEAGLRLGGTLFVVQDCEASFNLHGVVVVSGEVEISPEVPIPRVPDVEVPSPPDPPDMGGDDGGGDPLWMHECDLVANEDFALRANVEARVNATLNFWGKKGPKIDMLGVPSENTISGAVRVVPYFETRAHETWCLVPSTAAGGTSQTTQGCLETEG